MIEECLNVKRRRRAPNFPGVCICEIVRGQWCQKTRRNVIPIAKQSPEILKVRKTAHQGVVPQPIVLRRKRLRPHHQTSLAREDAMEELLATNSIIVPTSPCQVTIEIPQLVPKAKFK